MQSIRAVREISEAEAAAAVEKVFEKCYNDTEPIGRIPRHSNVDWQCINNDRANSNRAGKSYTM